MTALVGLALQFHTDAVHQLAVAMSGSGFIDWLTAKNAQVQALVRLVSVTVGVVFVVYQAVASRFTVARIIISGIAAGLFIWLVFNVTSIKDRVDHEVNSMGRPAVVQIGSDAAIAAVSS